MSHIEEREWWRSDPRKYRISLADLSDALGAHIVICSSPETQHNTINALSVVQNLPKRFKEEFKHKLSSLVDCQESAARKRCFDKVRSVAGSTSATHHDDFNRDITGSPGEFTREFSGFIAEHRGDLEARARAMKNDLFDVAKQRFAIRNSQWNSYWSGKIAGGLSMALTMTQSIECNRDILMQAVGLGNLNKDTQSLRAVIAVMIDGGPVMQEEQRKMAELCDEVIFDLRRRGYEWATHAYVLPVAFPDVETMLRSLADEKNLTRSANFLTRQTDEFLYNKAGLMSLPMAWEFTGSVTDLESPKRVSFFKEDTREGAPWKKALLDDKVDISPAKLYKTATCGDLDGTKRLLKARASVENANSNDDDGSTALHTCAFHNLVDVMELLLRHQGDKDREKYANECDNNGRTPVMFAANLGHRAALQTLLNAGANVNKADDLGSTPACIAAGSGHTDALQVLLSARADVTAAGNDGSAPICIAARRGHKDTLQMLLDAKANVNTVSSLGTTPIQTAAFGGHEEALQILLKARADVNRIDNRGQTPTYIAAFHGHKGALQMLLTARCDANEPISSGLTPTHIAAVNGHKEALRILLDARAKVDVVDRDGFTSMCMAARRGRKDVLQMLLNAGANPHTANNRGGTAICYAAANGHIDALHLLLDARADSNIAMIDGNTPISFAAKGGHDNAMQALLHARADLITTTEQGQTPVHMAAMNGRTEALQILLIARADANTADNRGETPMYKAAEAGQMEIMDILMKAGVNINEGNKEGNTPCSIARQKKHMDVVEKLMQQDFGIYRCRLDGIHEETTRSPSKGVLHAPCTMSEHLTTAQQIHTTFAMACERYQLTPSSSQLKQILIKVGCNPDAVETLLSSLARRNGGNVKCSELVDLVFGTCL